MSQKKNTKKIIIGAVLVLVIGFLWVQASGTPNSGAQIAASGTTGQKVVIYKSPTCGCCTNYAAYMKREGFDVEIVQTQDMDAIKEKYGIPGSLESCHTTVVGDKVVEGHVPVEAVIALLQSNDVYTIGMPGMPSGSPGMPGPKVGAFTVSSVDNNGEVADFMKL